MKMLLKLKENEIVENNNFNELLDLCFDISDYFSFTNHVDYAINDGDCKNFWLEINPFLIKKFTTWHWFCYYIGKKIESLEISIFSCEKQAKHVIQKYFNNLFLRERCPEKYLPEDLCFYIKNELLLGTVSHEHICWLYPNNEETKKHFEKICEWEKIEFIDDECVSFKLD